MSSGGGASDELLSCHRRERICRASSLWGDNSKTRSQQETAVENRPVQANVRAYWA